jgi:superfamily II DNA helicase RecQ
MTIHVLTIPFNSNHGVFDDEGVSRFLINKRVKRLEPAFFTHEGKPYWSVYVEYESILTTDEKPPPKLCLTNDQTSLLNQLRKWRKVRADKDGVPVFIVATNAHLEKVVVKQPTSLEVLKQIDGFGKKKMEKYGSDILGLVKAFNQSDEYPKAQSPASTAGVDIEPDPLSTEKDTP